MPKEGMTDGLQWTLLGAHVLVSVLAGAPGAIAELLLGSQQIVAGMQAYLAWLHIPFSHGHEEAELVAPRGILGSPVGWPHLTGNGNDHDPRTRGRSHRWRRGNLWRFDNRYYPWYH